MSVGTKRVESAPSQNKTSRVSTSGATPSGIGSDTWGGTFGVTWGQTWYMGTVGTTAAPSQGRTSRITAASAVNKTKRVLTSDAGESSIGTDTWGGTWGGFGGTLGLVWGKTWHTGAVGTNEAPSLNVTKRVPVDPT